MKETIIFGAVALLCCGAASAADWPSGYSKCADEGGTCKAGASSRQVSYGIKDKWVIATLSGDVLCATASFGSDPNSGLAKKCAVGPLFTPTPTPTPTPIDATFEAAPTTGWAGQNGGTTGGAAAPATAIYKVNSASQLMAAITAQGDNPKIVKLYGTIDPTSADNGGPYTSTTDQAARLQIRLGSNTTLIGMGGDTKLVNANIVINDKQNVIVRNINIVNPCD